MHNTTLKRKGSTYDSGLDKTPKKNKCNMLKLEPCLIIGKCLYYYHAKFQDAGGLRKMRCTPSFSRLRQFIEFLLGQYSVIRRQRKVGIDLVWKISDPSIKFHIGSNICNQLSHTYLKLRLTI